MKRLLILCLGLLLAAGLPAQDSLDWDIDSVFDEPPEEPSPQEPKPEAQGGATVQQLIKKQGVTFDVAFEFITGFSPGWDEPPVFSWKAPPFAWKDFPWFSVSLDNQSPDFEYYLKMRNTVGMNAQILENFRVRTTIKFELPFYGFRLGDFFFDYSIYNTVFIRGGKYNHSWGISPNYHFTNLLSRVPREGYAGDSYIIKADVPTGIGGFQVLAMTRANMINNTPLLKPTDIGYGAKYNLALRWVDLDLGAFYQEGMVLRSFLSVKTTLWKTELYTEGLLAFDVEDTSNMSGAVSFGFGRDFFDGKLNINGELFYNTERDVYRYHPETNIREAGKSPFIEGFNVALNVLLKFGGKGNVRLLAEALYAPEEDSAQVVPGFKITPLPNIEFYVAAPIALGSKDGYYYKNPIILDTQKQPVPFCVLIMLTFKGNA